MKSNLKNSVYRAVGFIIPLWGIFGLLLPIFVRLNPEKEWAKNVFWMVCLVLDKDFGISRDELMLKLKEKGIDTRPFFYPMSYMPMYWGKPVNPVAEKLSKSGINLPSSVNLKKENVEWICREIIKLIL